MLRNMLFLRSVTLRILTFYDAIMIVVLVKSHENDVSCFVTGCFYKFTIADLTFYSAIMNAERKYCLSCSGGRT